MSPKDYSPFGSLMPNRGANTNLYRYGYQGSEKDDEVKGSGNSYTTEFRMLDTRLGRWLSIDPVSKPHESPYVSMGNTPIWHNDPQGNTDDKARKSNPNNPNAKGGKDKFHSETKTLTQQNQQIQQSSVSTTAQEVNNTSNSIVQSTPTPTTSISTPAPLVGVSAPTGQSNQTVGAYYPLASQQTGDDADAGYLGMAKTGVGYADPIGGFYDKLIYNHKTYTTTKGLEKALPRSGQMSKQAANALKVSQNVKITANGLSFIGTAISYYDVYNQIQAGEVQVGTVSDATVGTIGIGETAAGYFFGTSCPPLAIGCAAYGLIRVTYNTWYQAASGGLEQYNKAYPIEKPGNLIYHICFTKGTLVKAETGLVPIEEIKDHDYVYTYNIEKDTIELGEVINVLQRTTSEIYKITTTNQEINVTSEHPFYVEGKGWVKVKDLLIGYVLKTADGKRIELIKSIDKSEGPITVYNIEVSGNHNYFISSSSILVHNKYIQDKSCDSEKYELKNSSKKR